MLFIVFCPFLFTFAFSRRDMLREYRQECDEDTVCRARAKDTH